MPASRDEFSLIDVIRARVPPRRGVPVGIGDDTALLTPSSQAGTLVTVDVLMEGVHFDLSQASPEVIGRKALAVNLSDIAAMAGRPTACVVGLVLPRAGGNELGMRLMQGLIELANEFDVAVVGGDTNSWDGPLVVSVTLLGEPTGRGPVTRAGARDGDVLLVTGPLGGSLEGRHLSFVPRVAAAQQLHEAVELHALIDLSDGLASDVRHIARESDVGIVIDAEAVPVHHDVDGGLSVEQRLHHALTDGEDFELLLAVSPGDAARLEARPLPGTSVIRIGEVTHDSQCLLRQADESIVQLPDGGWRHQFAE